MISLPRNSTLGTALVLLAAGLFIAPALFPVQAVLVHDTGPVTFDGPDEFTEEGIEVLSYENMSERGQTLYVRTLESGGTYQVSPGEGAPDFEYLTSEQRQNARAENARTRPGMIVIERPANADLPPADEAFKRSGPEGDIEEEEEDEHRQQVQRYDMMKTSTEPPSLGSVTQLLRLGAALLGVVSLSLGGYLRSVN